MLNTMKSREILFLWILLAIEISQSGLFFAPYRNFLVSLDVPRNFFASWPLWLSPPSILLQLLWAGIYITMVVSAWLVWKEKLSSYKALLWWGWLFFFNALWVPMILFPYAFPLSFSLLDQMFKYYLLPLSAIRCTLGLGTIILFFKISKIAAFLIFLSFLEFTCADVINYIIWDFQALGMVHP